MSTCLSLPLSRAFLGKAPAVPHQLPAPFLSRVIQPLIITAGLISAIPTAIITPPPARAGLSALANPAASAARPPRARASSQLLPRVRVCLLLLLLLLLRVHARGLGAAGMTPQRSPAGAGGGGAGGGGGGGGGVGVGGGGGGGGTSALHYLSGPYGDTTYTKVFVGGLAWETRSEGLRAHFEVYGDIMEAVVITDRATGRSKGYGFVSTPSPSSSVFFLSLSAVLVWDAWSVRFFFFLLGVRGQVRFWS